jgi:hypothetical protein
MFNQGLLKNIADKCPEYEAITLAQGYGISFLNNLEALEEAQCDLCINWQDGSCNIFQEYKEKY